jgi:hypothetical protein
MSDTKKFRQAFKDAGFRQAHCTAPVVYNDRAKDGTTRLKLWDGDHVFAAPGFAQQELERQLKKQFGGRYLYGMFVRKSDFRGGYYTDCKSFIIKVLTRKDLK